MSTDRTVVLERISRDADVGSRSVSRRSNRWVSSAEPLAAAGAACVLFVLGFGGGPGRLAAPLGGGDLLPAYVNAWLWGNGAPFGDTSFGFPFGLEQRYYPAADILPNVVAGLVAWLTDNPFLALNVVFALSFPVTALAAVWVFRIAGLRGPWTVLAALALTFVPYHWFRLEHVYLATMYSAVLGVGLALLVGNGTVERRLRAPQRRQFLFQLALLAIVIGASGVYYACFTALLCGGASLYRLIRGAGWRDLLLTALPPVAVLVAVVAVMAPSIVYASAHPPIDAVAARGVGESVTYAGALVLALLPAPISRIPGLGPVNGLGTGALDAMGSIPVTEVHNYSNFGSVATVVALAIFAGGALLLARRRALTGAPLRSAPEPASVELGLVVALIITTLLFFVPWGLNYLFAYLVTPDLRGWNRLVPVLFTLVFVGAGLVVQQLRLRLRPAVVAGLGVLAVLVLVFDAVLPYRAMFDARAADGSRLGGASHQYAAALNAAVPGACGVLQLPYIAYPEVPPKMAMGNYEQMWPAVGNPEKSWSFGAMKGTLASEWQKALGDAVDADDIPPLVAGGFCAVHLDKRGYPADEADEVAASLEDLLGEPVAEGLDGNWLAYALPTGSGVAADRDALLDAPDGVGTFYAPPRVAPVRGVPDPAQVDAFSVTWWMGEGESEFSFTSLDGGPAFSSVQGSLRAGACAEQDVVLTLTSGDGEESTSITLGAGREQSFDLRVDAAVRDARLTVTTVGETCEASEEGAAGAVGLVDPRAVG